MAYIFDGVSLQNKRKNNMDSLLIKKIDLNGQEVLLAVVCDGVGSLNEGDIASKVSVTMLNEWFSSLSSLENIGLQLRNKIIDINQYIIEQSQENNIVTASTLSALIICKNYYYVAHLGDSRIYKYACDELSLISFDDVSDSGKLKGYIGKNEDIFIHYMEDTFDEAVFLLCSDGLYKKLDEQFLQYMLIINDQQDIKDAIQQLVNTAIQNNEEDNISVAIIKAY